LIDMKLAASISFIAFGVNFFGAIVLLLLNAGSRSVRWYLPFQLCVLVWLFANGVTFLFEADAWHSVQAFAVAMMPLMFFIFGWMDLAPRPAWHAMVLMALAAPVVPVVMTGVYMSELSPRADTIAMLWSVIGWIGGSFMLWLQGRRDVRRAPERRDVRKKIILLAFTLITPISVVGAILLEGMWFIIFVIPVLTILIMLLIFYGMTQLQFYDVEVRARRTSDIAAETFETGRLAVLGELAATIAHEVRNPLTGVRSLAQRIATDDVSADKRRQYAQVILDETSRVEAMVANLLDLARRHSRQNADNAATRLAPLFADLHLLVSARALDKGVAVQVHVPETLVAAAPRDVVAQALLNLMLNGIAHSPQDSTVTVEAHANGGGVEILVRDRGPGIAPADRQRIFEPFYTTRSGGTGLGLSVVRHIAREHGWQVSVGDAPGGGAEFKLVIP
jgi:signal transduction histidine kinase